MDEQTRDPGFDEGTLFSWPADDQEPRRMRRSPGLASLVAERRRLYDLLDALPDMICVLDQDHHPVFSNGRFRAQFGESEGRRCHEFIWGLSEPCQFCQADEVLESGVAQHWEIQRDGDKTIALHHYPFADIDGSPLVIEIGVDISEQRRAETELASHRERLEELVQQRTSDLQQAMHHFKSLFVSSPDAIFITRRDGTIVDANPTASRLFGWTLEEFRSMGRSALLDARDPRSKAALGEQARSGTVVGREVTAIRKGGECFTIEVDSVRLPGDESESFIIARDITERRRAERESLITARALDQAEIGVVRADGNGRISLVNDALTDALGYTRDELLGSNLFDLAVGLDAQNWPARWEQVRSVHAQSLERDFRAKDGSTVPMRVSIAMIEVDGEEFANAFMRNVSDERAAQEALAEREEQLRQSQKMEAIGQLAGGIAHDFNNLLTTIIGNSALLLGRSGLDEGDRELVEDIKQVADRAAGLTKQILAFSRRQLLHPETVSLNAIIDDVVPLLRRSLGEQIELRLSLAADPAFVAIDPTQVHQVIVNLAVNARDAMPAGGRLVIATKNAELDEAFCSTRPECRPGRYVQLTVSDSGMGMDAATLSHIFEPFFTTKEMGKGTGLGLATVFGVIKQSEGSILVSSKPGRGTTFEIYVPEVQATAAPAAAQSLDEASLRGRETILVVEDEPSVRQLVVRVLSRAGYTVLEAGSAVEAERALDEGGVPDVVLSDMVLPGGVNGRTLAGRLRERLPRAKIIFMSGYAHDVVEGDKAEDWVHFLGKPFTPAALLEEVRAAIGEDAKA